MTATREELHRLVDALDEETVPTASVLLYELAGEDIQRPRHHMSFVGALHGGPPDLGEQHEEHLRDYFDRSA